MQQVERTVDIDYVLLKAKHMIIYIYSFVTTDYILFTDLTVSENAPLSSNLL